MQESQKNIITGLKGILDNIFSLHSSNDMIAAKDLQSCFKVLVYDDKVFEILAPMLKVYILRENNISFNLNIKDHKEKLPDVMAIYFITLNEDNLNLLSNDIANKIFDNYCINFVSYDANSQYSQNILNKFFSMLSSSEAYNNIYNISVVPIDLSAYHPRVFSLNIKRPYLFLNTPNVSDEEYKIYLSKVTSGIFSCLYMLKTIPLIKYRSGFFADDIIKKIQENYNYLFEKFPEKKEEFIMTKKNSHTLLIILDRESDIPIALHHGCSFGSMINDICGICRYKNSKDTNKYEVDPVNDYVWNKSINKPFYEVGEYILSEIKKSYDEMKYLDKVSKPKDMDQLIQESQKLAQSIENLRDKKIIDNLLTQNSNFYNKINEEATKKSLGKIYELETLILRKRNNITNDIKNKFVSIIKEFSSNEGMKIDLSRVCLIYLLCNNNVSQSELSLISQVLPNDLASNFIKMRKTQSVTKNQPQSGYIHSGLNFFMNSITNLMNVDQPSISADIVNSLTSNVKKPNFVTYNTYKKAFEKENMSFNYSDVIVFMVGGGSLSELEYIEGLLDKGGKKVIYGCDYLYRPNEFMQDLEELGRISNNN